MAGFPARRALLVCVVSVATGVTAQAAGAAAPSPGMVSAYAERHEVDSVEAQRRLELQAEATGIVEALEGELGRGFGGVWFDNEEGRFRVALATPARAAREKVTTFLAERGLANDTDVRQVRWSYAELVNTASRVSERLGRPSELAVAPDVERNGLQVQIARDAGTPAWTAVRRVRAASAMPLRTIAVAPALLEARPAVCGWPSCSRPLRGSVRIENASAPLSCTTGFPAYVPGSPGPDRYMLTAGHCSQHAGTWYAWRTDTGGVESVGPSAGVVFSGPWGDAGTIRVNGQWNGVLQPWVAAWNAFGGVINEAHQVSGSAASYVGLFGCRFGQTTPFQCGNVTAVDSPVTYSGITFTTLTRTDTCALGGDSGGPWMAGNTAYGIVVASTTAGCTNNPATQAMWYNEVNDALGLIGVSLITTATGAI